MRELTQPGVWTLFVDDLGHTVGQAIETPSGVFLWGQDYEVPADEREDSFVPRFLDAVDSIDRARDRIELRERLNRE